MMGFLHSPMPIDLSGEHAAAEGTYFVDAKAAVLARAEFNALIEPTLSPSDAFTSAMDIFVPDELRYIYGDGGKDDRARLVNLPGAVRTDWQWLIPGYQENGPAQAGINPLLANRLLVFHNQHAHMVSAADATPHFLGDMNNPFDDHGVSDSHFYLLGCLTACRGIRYSDPETPPPTEEAKLLNMESLHGITAEAIYGLDTLLLGDGTSALQTQMITIFDYFFKQDPDTLAAATMYNHPSARHAAAYIYSLCAFSEEYLAWQANTAVKDSPGNELPINQTD